MHFSYNWISITSKCLIEDISLQGKAWAIWHQPFPSKTEQTSEAFQAQKSLRYPSGALRGFCSKPWMISASSPALQSKPALPQSWYCCCKDAEIPSSALPSLAPPWTDRLSGPWSPACSPCSHAALSGESGQEEHHVNTIYCHKNIYSCHYTSHVQAQSILEEGSKVPARKQDKFTDDAYKCHLHFTLNVKRLHSVPDLSFFIW